MVYSTNQNRQLYVVADASKTAPTALGDIAITKTAEGQLFFKHMGQGGLNRSDLIDLDKICYAKVTRKAAMQRYLKQAVVTLGTAVNGGTPIAGQDYILRIYIKNYLASGDENVAIKHGVVHAYAGMTAAQFYTKLADSLTANFSREVQPLLTFTASTTGVTITEVEQPWVLGTRQQEPVNFEVVAGTVRYQGEDMIWTATANDEDGKIAITNTATVIGNGKKIADLEYFCMGERADQYRLQGWPNVIPTKYMVDPEKEYDVLDIHYFYSGDGVQVHKSEKTITLVGEAAASDDVISAIKTKLTGLGVTVTE